jgi:hypothetical protein
MTVEHHPRERSCGTYRIEESGQDSNCQVHSEFYRLSKGCDLLRRAATTNKTKCQHKQPKLIVSMAQKSEYLRISSSNNAVSPPNCVGIVPPISLRPIKRVVQSTVQLRFPSFTPASPPRLVTTYQYPELEDLGGFLVRGESCP